MNMAALPARSGFRSSCLRSTDRFSTTTAFLSSFRLFHSQHRTPILPQLHTSEPSEAPDTAPEIFVGYLLHRHPVVKPVLHPVERQLGFLVDRQHQLYSRHPTDPSSVHFFRDRQHQSMDIKQRTDPVEIQRDFFGLEGYQEALQASLQRYVECPSRLKPGDFVPVEAHASSSTGSPSPPTRHTLQRKLDDYLYLIVRYASHESGVADNDSLGKIVKQCGWASRWGIPFALRSPRETLKMTAQRCLQEPHQARVDYYLWSNAPQGCLPLMRCSDKKKKEKGASEGPSLFLYSATYLAGKPNFKAVQPAIDEHAWVSRREMLQYRDEFASSQLLELLQDVSADAYFETE